MADQAERGEQLAPRLAALLPSGGRLLVVLASLRFGNFPGSSRGRPAGAAAQNIRGRAGDAVLDSAELASSQQSSPAPS